MQFPHDGGLSCVRAHLAERGTILESLARSAVQAPEGCSGTLVCQCRGEGYWGIAARKERAWLICGCNGSDLPVYIGRPPSDRVRGSLFTPVGCCGLSAFHVAIGIGYPGPVPRLGKVEVEAAQSVAIVVECRECAELFVAWTLHLPEPYEVRGDEPWLKGIQGHF